MPISRRSSFVSAVTRANSLVDLSFDTLQSVVHTRAPSATADRHFGIVSFHQIE